MPKKPTLPTKLEVDINVDKTPILFTEHIFIHSSSNGITLDFGQKLGPNPKIHIVSRLGMSRTQAKNLFQELGKILAITETGTSKQ